MTILRMAMINNMKTAQRKKKQLLKTDDKFFPEYCEQKSGPHAC